MGLFGKSKKEKEAEYLEQLDIPASLTENFKLVVDDVFTIIGVGTVATGTAENGMCRVGEDIEIVTANDTLKSTITGIDVHTKERKANGCGYRTEHLGIGLRGISKEQVNKGDILIVKNGGMYAR
ncbi:MAG: EF-Tu/IF-2/RF-3 family GTPase [Lachnospiraceae bacterium]|nr:EF-Tu/IF-2/RF-3 family GTPase [Lachnospiraceae bacterium]MDD3616596.1 EF-Tu/IF-2/RF-3 family GTPase [Lachnospiraceae bacterium]